MVQLFAKIGSIILSHRFSIEIFFIGLSGITIPVLIAADHAVKILIGLVTLYVIIARERRERKKDESKGVN